MNSRVIIVPIYYIILVTCIGISSILSYYGLQSNLGFLTPFAVIIIALGLFSAGILLQTGRDKESISQQILAVLLFLVFAMASTSSNINKLYTDRMWQSVRNAAFLDEYSKFNTTKVTVRSTINNELENDKALYEKIAIKYNEWIISDISNFKRIITGSQYYQDKKEIEIKLMAELGDMEVQATDPLAPGCGVKCRQHASAINELVPTTETILPKGRKLEEIKANIQRFENEKLNAFCSQGAYADFHLLKGLVEVIPASNYCASVGDYFDKYGSNKLDKLFERVGLPSIENAQDLTSYSENILAVSADLQAISVNISTLTPDYASLKVRTEYPNALNDAIAILENDNTDPDRRDLGKMELRQALIQDLSSEEFLTVDVLFTPGSDVQNFILNDDLSQNSIVKNQNEPIKPFLEMLAKKQDEIITKFEEAMPKGSEIPSFELVEPDSGEIGEIEQTLSSAFFDTPSLKNTIIATIIGFSFDLIPLIFAFVAFHGYVPEEEDYDPVIG